MLYPLFKITDRCSIRIDKITAIGYEDDTYGVQYEHGGIEDVFRFEISDVDEMKEFHYELWNRYWNAIDDINKERK
jgi:hypothetical protein